MLIANIHRRHMTKGQRAMAVAKIYPEPEKGGRGKKGDNNYQVSRQYVGHARTVLQYAPDLAANVLSGAESLIHRRHMTKGQRAMAVAMIYPGGSGKGANPKNLGLSAELIRQGRTVLEYAPDLAANVLSGAARRAGAGKRPP